MIATQAVYWIQLKGKKPWHGVCKMTDMYGGTQVRSFCGVIVWMSEHGKRYESCQSPNGQACKSCLRSLKAKEAWR